MRAKVGLILGFVCFFSNAAFAPAAQAPTASFGTAQSEFSSGDYRGSLQEISRLLGTNAAKPGSKTRYDAMMLRGECLLRLKMQPAAREAFLAASRVQRQDADLTETATAEGMAILVEKSTDLHYTPAHGDPIDIVDEAQRKTALAALYADTLADVQPKIDKAMGETSVDALHGLLPELLDLYALEVASTGKPQKSLELGKAMGERARELIATQVKEIAWRVEVLNDQSEAPTAAGSGQAATLSRAGLTAAEQKECEAAIEKLNNMRQISQQGRRLALRLGGSPSLWESIIADATDALTRAQTVAGQK